MATTFDDPLARYLKAKRASGWSIRQVARWGHVSTTTAWRIVKNVPMAGNDGRGWPDRNGRQKQTDQD